MTAPRLEIDLAKICHNARSLVDRLAGRGISVLGVTKASCGAPPIADALLRAGVRMLGDSRIENIEAMTHAELPAQMALIRSPMLSQVDRVVRAADLSFNTEPRIIAALSAAARRQGRTHGVVLMVELGDLREGIMPDDLAAVVHGTLGLPNIAFRGIGTNLGCRSGVVPDAAKMAELSRLAEAVEADFDLSLDIVSGGNSGNLRWALGGADTGRINNLRLGEAILLGREPLHRQAIDGLHTDAITLVAEVIESKRKPSRPWGTIAQAAFGGMPSAIDRGPISQAILAIGQQDIDPEGLRPPAGCEILGASSDHLVMNTGREVLPVGAELVFQINYSALLRAMTSPFVAKVMTGYRIASARRPAAAMPAVPTGQVMSRAVGGFGTAGKTDRPRAAALDLSICH